MAGGAQYNQGYPFPQQIAITSRPNSGGSTAVYLVPLGDVRYERVH